MHTLCGFRREDEKESDVGRGVAGIAAELLHTCAALRLGSPLMLLTVSGA